MTSHVLHSEEPMPEERTQHVVRLLIGRAGAPSRRYVDSRNVGRVSGADGRVVTIMQSPFDPAAHTPEDGWEAIPERRPEVALLIDVDGWAISDADRERLRTRALRLRRAWLKADALTDADRERLRQPRPAKQDGRTTLTLEGLSACGSIYWALGPGVSVAFTVTRDAQGVRYHAAGRIVAQDAAWPRYGALHADGATADARIAEALALAAKVAADPAVLKVAAMLGMTEHEVCERFARVILKTAKRRGDGSTRGHITRRGLAVALTATLLDVTPRAVEKHLPPDLGESEFFLR